VDGGRIKLQIVEVVWKRAARYRNKPRPPCAFMRPLRAHPYGRYSPILPSPGKDFDEDTVTIFPAVAVSWSARKTSWRRVRCRLAEPMILGGAVRAAQEVRASSTTSVSTRTANLPSPENSIHPSSSDCAYRNGDLVGRATKTAAA
jgi:hypothetical protein